MPDKTNEYVKKRVRNAVSENSTELNLSGLELKTLPSEVFNFSGLTGLNLSDNHFDTIPKALANLPDLRFLRLSGNEIKEIPESIRELIHLQSLNLSNNQIAKLPDSLAFLENLRDLGLYGNYITLPTEVDKLSNLSNLEILELGNNRIKEIPSSFGNLTSIRILGLSVNNIQGLPNSFINLSNLENISLFRNHLARFPELLCSLTSLQNLELEANQLYKIPESIGNLKNLKILSLHNTRIAKIPEAIGCLTNLETLHLGMNRIKSIPPSLGNLANLKGLFLQSNQITAIPETFIHLTNLESFSLHGNIGLGIPVEILGEEYGFDKARAAEILEYCLRVQVNGRPLNEAKLILVGRGAVGKTSLVERLIEGTFSPGKTKTEGIKIDRWTLNSGDEEIQLNVWDFGGQEIMHATHQFFLTERSVYLLVLNGREGGEDAEAEYWLKLIEGFGGKSPVIIVFNKFSEHAFDLNRNSLIEKYPNIKGFVRTDCGDNLGISDLKQLILRETGNLDELRVKFPGEWFEVKDTLASMQKNYLSFDRYRSLCKRNKIHNKQHQEMLARYLNQLGIVLNYKDDPRLRDTHVLNPRWVTEGIYKLLNSHILEEKHGEIYLDEISGILPEKDYPINMCRFIFDLMKKFDLCFSFPDDECHYLIPELLSKNQPNEAKSFDLTRCLNFQYHYPILPEGLLPRFITRTHYLSENEPRWRSGVILKFEGCRALVRADAVEKKVFISITGDSAESRRRLLAVIRSDFERIHHEIKNLNPVEMVPLPGLPSEVVSYQNLLVMESRGIKEFPHVVETDVIYYQISELLNGIDLPKQWEENNMDGITLFYSYAHKDEAYKTALETHLKILQRQNVITGWSDREIEAGENWRQEIIGNLNSSDIILLLISSDFMASDFCYDIEMKRAMERHEDGEARVIPIIVRDCVWTSAPFGQLQALPKDGKSVDTWENKDSAWKNVSEGIERAANSLRKA